MSAVTVWQPAGPLLWLAPALLDAPDSAAPAVSLPRQLVSAVLEAHSKAVWQNEKEVPSPTASVSAGACSSNSVHHLHTASAQGPYVVLQLRSSSCKAASLTQIRTASWEYGLLASPDSAVGRAAGCSPGPGTPGGAGSLHRRAPSGWRAAPRLQTLCPAHVAR